MREFCAVEPRKQNIELFIFLQVTVCQNENFLISSSFNKTDGNKIKKNSILFLCLETKYQEMILENSIHTQKLYLDINVMKFSSRDMLGIDKELIQAKESQFANMMPSEIKLKELPLLHKSNISDS